MAWHLMGEELCWLLTEPQLRAYLDERGVRMAGDVPIAARWRGTALYMMLGRRWRIARRSPKNGGLEGMLEDYPFRVEELSRAGELVRVIAYLDHPIIARATFRATVEQYPKARIRLRNRALVMAGRRE